MEEEFIHLFNGWSSDFMVIQRAMPSTSMINNYFRECRPSIDLDSWTNGVSSVPSPSVSDGQVHHSNVDQLPGGVSKQPRPRKKMLIQTRFAKRKCAWRIHKTLQPCESNHYSPANYHLTPNPTWFVFGKVVEPTGESRGFHVSLRTGKLCDPHPNDPK